MPTKCPAVIGKLYYAPYFYGTPKTERQTVVILAADGPYYSATHFRDDRPEAWWQLTFLTPDGSIKHAAWREDSPWARVRS